VLATLEAAARLEDYFEQGAALLKPYSINTLFRPSPFGKEGRPGARFAKWSMNSYGYRGPEPQPGAVKVVAYGASETFGTYESPDGEYPRQLEALLNRSGGPAYNVINIALPGVRIGRVGYLEQAVRQMRPEWVIIYPSPSNYIGATVPFCGQPTGPVPVELGLGDLLRFPGKVEQLSKAIVPVPMQTLVRRVLIWRALPASGAMDRVPKATIDAFHSDVECAVRASRDLGARVIVLTHATRFGDAADPDDDLLVAWRLYYPELREQGFLDLEQRANASLLDLRFWPGVVVVDAAHRMPAGAAYFADPVHFTDAGARALAALIAREIVRDRAAGAD
jgi:lysophospholipase L1-like esterase